jgi:chromate transporter
MADSIPGHGVSYGEAVRVWTRIALLSFGGPAGQIAVMHRILVEEKRWIGETRFLHALNYCMLLPGPEAQQLATYIGWLMHKTKGGLTAGALFVLPGFLAILGLSFVYALLGRVPLIEGLFFGLKAAVIAIVLQALVRIGSRALRTAATRVVALAAFVAIFLFGVPFPIIVLAAGLIGFAAARAGSLGFSGGGAHGPALATRVEDADSLLGEEVPDHARPTKRWSLAVSAILLVLWLTPVAALLLLAGPDHVFTRIAVFFSQIAVVTFGGAYAVLAYVAQQAVDTYGWVTPGEMVDGLALAETTPGPLIMVTQFVGFMGALRNPGGLDQLLAATVGAVLTTWVTFVPCFLWIFLGAPFAERMRGNRALGAALTAISAAVVGVILNLALWFAAHALFARMVELPALGVELPDFASVRPAALALTLLAAFALFRLRAGVLPVLAGCALAGIGLRLSGLA